MRAITSFLRPCVPRYLHQPNLCFPRCFPFGTVHHLLSRNVSVAPSTALHELCFCVRFSRPRRDRRDSVSAICEVSTQRTLCSAGRASALLKHLTLQPRGPQRSSSPPRPGRGGVGHGFGRWVRSCKVTLLKRDRRCVSGRRSSSLHPAWSRSVANARMWQSTVCETMTFHSFCFSSANGA